MEEANREESPAPTPSRRPRGFAAVSAVTTSMTEEGESSLAKGRKEREKEKERTKFRERHRRAITSRILTGLRQYGNFSLPARADMNDVLAALARESGWIVEADGTTYRSSGMVVPVSARSPRELGSSQVRSVESPLSATTLLNHLYNAPMECFHTGIGDTLSPPSLDSFMGINEDVKDDKYTTTCHIESKDCLEADEYCAELQMPHEMHLSRQENDYSGTPYVPIYVMLATGVVNGFCQLVDLQSIRQELLHLKSMSVDGVVVTCWWGIVEGWAPQKYLWSGYRDLFNIIREFKLKLQVVLAFNEYLAIRPGDFSITLPKWVLEIGKDNQDIFFTDREGRRNTECLSWGIDKERVLKGRNATEVYFDFMRSFRMDFDDFFREGIISSVEIGLGASGELKYPSFSERLGWRYPGIGEFQCYDKYLQQSLCRAAKLRGHSFWFKGPDNAGHYNSQPHETVFFSDRGDYDSYYGRFFLRWYSQILIDHADHVLTLARLAFEETEIIVKIPAVHWWYKTTSHAAELTAGFYNPTNRDGYLSVFEILKKHSVTLKYVFPETLNHQNEEASADSEGLSWQLLNTAWDKGLTIACQNSHRCHGREDLKRYLEIAKPSNDPDLRHISFFAYQRPSTVTSEDKNWFKELDYLLKSMHGTPLWKNPLL